MSNTSLLVITIMIIAQATSDPFNWNALVTLAMAILLAWNTYRSQKRDKEMAEAKLAQREATLAQQETKAVVEKVAEKVEVIHKETNSMKDALVTVTAKAARAEGREEERTEERARVDEKASVSTEPMPVSIVSQANPVIVTDVSKGNPTAPAPAPAEPQPVVIVNPEPVKVEDVSAVPDAKKKGKGL